VYSRTYVALALLLSPNRAVSARYWRRIWQAAASRREVVERATWPILICAASCRAVRVWRALFRHDAAPDYLTT